MSVDFSKMRLELRAELRAAELRLGTSNSMEYIYYRRLVEIAHTDDQFCCDLTRRVKEDGGFFCN